jgi:hypothetical protein
MAVNETDAQKIIMAQGMCGELLHGGRDICILAPGHGDHPESDITDRIARVIYAADYAGEPSYKTFDTLHQDDQDHYRAMAAAVVEELFTQEWVIMLGRGPNLSYIHKSLQGAQSHAQTVVLNNRRHRVSEHDAGLEQVGDDIPPPPIASRYVTEWVRGEVS